jgi:hypothetical protein
VSLAEVTLLEPNDRAIPAFQSRVLAMCAAKVGLRGFRLEGVNEKTTPRFRGVGRCSRNVF